MQLTEEPGEPHPDVSVLRPSKCFSTFNNIASSLLPGSSSGKGFKETCQSPTLVRP